MKVCRFCRYNNMISDSELEKNYGLDVLNPRRRGEKPFIEEIRYKVMYFSTHMHPTAREYAYTQNPVNFPGGHGASQQQLMFWLPHLEKQIDLHARRRATLELARVVRRLFVQRTMARFTAPRVDQYNFIVACRHQEIHRAKRMQDPRQFGVWNRHGMCGALHTALQFTDLVREPYETDESTGYRQVPNKSWAVSSVV